MIILVIAAVGALAAGLLAILYGLSYKEFSFGNTILLAGVIGSCTGLLMFGQWIAARDIRASVRRMATSGSDGLRDPSLPQLNGGPSKPVLPSRPPARETATASLHDEPQPPSFPPFPQAEIEDRPVEHHLAPPDLAPTPVAEPAAEPKPKPRRNLMFESSVRKDRERAAAGPEGAAPSIEVGQRPAFHDPIAQRGADRADRARSRSPSSFPDPKTDITPDVTVLKSGVVDGMAYSLYSDGSIEAQMPEGMMRFVSIEELRTHLDQRT